MGAEGMERIVLSYWRNSLADETRLSVSASLITDEKAVKAPFKALVGGHLGDHVYERCWSLLLDLMKFDVGRKRDGEDFRPEKVEVLVAPLFLGPKFEHREARKGNRLAPLWLPAALTQDGCLVPTKAQPWISRECLDPAGPDAVILGTVAAQDAFLGETPYEPKTWGEVVSWAELLWSAVTGGPLFDFQHEDLTVLDPKNFRLIPWNDGSGMTSGIMNAYNLLLAKEGPLPDLLREATRVQAVRHEPGMELLGEGGLKASLGKHLGQMKNKFQLSPSQRESLKHFAAIGNGEMLAVNGPPGTGKTTLLHSVIATNVVSSAVAGQDPCVMVASSTNNTAVTNVVESFATQATDGFSTRWIPGVSSFGVYYPAADRKSEAMKAGYQCFEQESMTLIASLGSDESYFQEAEQAWLAAATGWLNLPAEMNLPQTLAEVRGWIRERSDAVVGCIAAWEELGSIREERGLLRLQMAASEERVEVLQQRVGAISAAIDIHRTGSEYPLRQDPNCVFQAWLSEEGNPIQPIEGICDALACQRQERAVRDAVCRRAQDLAMQWRRHADAAPWWLSVFAWIPPIARQAALRNEGFLVLQGFADWPTVTHEVEGQIKREILARREALASTERNLARMMEQLDQWLNTASRSVADMLADEQASIVAMRERLATMDVRESELVASLYKIGLEDGCSPMEQENVLDRGIRYQLFWAATHYWEGRWLLDRPAGGKRMSKADGIRWLAKLCPCMVITLHRLPTEFRERQELLLDFIDLLILDEAGQTSPQIGAVSFAFARKALVVGDTDQIAPVRAMTKGVDAANLDRAGLGGPEGLHEGATAFKGTMIGIAQGCSKFTKFESPKGMFLSEHRRCSDELVVFCNELAYKGRLVPKTGMISQESLLPSLDGSYRWGWGYAHIPGRVIHGQSGSGKSNPLEAATIARWISAHKEVIARVGLKPEEASRELKDAIGVITPYALQKKAIVEAFESEGLPNDIKVGTVHALQGAERPVVIFSPVVTKFEKGTPFFDREDQNPSMLNVAVSRAQHNFLVFGDIESMEMRPDGSPSRLLVKFLRADVRNQLVGVEIPPEGMPSGPKGPVSRLCDLDAHVAALKEAFQAASREVLIVSPWISGYVIDSEVAPLIREAASRGVTVKVYTDVAFNEEGGKLSPSASRAHELLKGAGAAVLWATGIHNKSLAVDDHTLMEGSFNWLSATRSVGSVYDRANASFVYRGYGVDRLIQEARMGMDTRLRRG
ncbi:MAG: AAA domain-containing protein [Holophagaceae bacterium]